MSGSAAADRVHRLLSLIPWLEQNHPSGADIAEVAERFDYPAADLVRDLTDVVNFVSADPYQSFLVFEILVTEDRIRVDRNDLLDKPMRMDPANLAALVAAADPLRPSSTRTSWGPWSGRSPSWQARGARTPRPCRSGSPPATNRSSR